MKLKWSSFVAAFAGIAFLLRTQVSARWHLMAGLLIVIIGFALHISTGEWLALIIAIALVITAEALNTAIEQACDAITLEQNPKIGHAKDLAAAGVLLASIFATIIGLLVFVPHLL